MSKSRKSRMSMLDGLTAAPAPQAAAPGSMISTNRALRSARDAVDAHQVWDLDPALIDDTRVHDRFAPHDVDDLRDSIEATGQAVPILVRRHPTEAERYLLVYGRRRLEAIRTSDKVGTVRALIANMDQRAATRAQITENMARRDLSYIERAVFARELIAQGFGNQSEVAEVLTVTPSSISMALGVVDAIGPELIHAIGPAHGVGRPRWSALAEALTTRGADRGALIARAERVHTDALVAQARNEAVSEDASVAAFEAVLAEVAPAPAPQPRKPRTSAPARALTIDGRTAAQMRRTGRTLRLDIAEGPFADWLEQRFEDTLHELHARMAAREDDA